MGLSAQARPKNDADETTPLCGAKCAEVEPQQDPSGDGAELSLYQRVTGGEKPLAWTVLTTLATCPTLIFASLHMVAFLKVHELTAMQIASAHLGYVVWNTVNDVFAGYISDGYAARYGSRLGFVCCLQVLWVMSTCLPFLAVPDYVTRGMLGVIYYLVCISLYDGCFSLVNVGRGALMEQITEGGEPERVHFKRLNCVFGNVEGLVNLAAYALWSETAPTPFLIFLGTMVALAISCNLWSSYKLRPYAPREICSDDAEVTPPLRAFLSSMSRNTWVYIGIIAVHELQSVFMGQFAILMIESLLVDWTKASRVALLATISTAGGVTVFLMTWVVDRFGLYRVLLWTFRTKVVLAAFLGALAAVVGLHAALVCTLLIVNEVSSAMVSGFFLVVMVSLMDELAASRRAEGPAHPLHSYPSTCGPALLMGVSACFVKPFNSVGPVLGAMLFAEDGASGQQGRERVFFLLASVPLVVGLVQLGLWGRLFTIRTAPHE